LFLHPELETLPAQSSGTNGVGGLLHGTDAPFPNALRFHCFVTAAPKGFAFQCGRDPSDHWTAQQLREAFAFTSPPKDLLRDRNGVYGLELQVCGEALGLQEVRIAPRFPWQSPHVERLTGSVRRECLDHVIVLNRAHLHRVLESYLSYYHGWRTHLGLEKNAPEVRRVATGAARHRRIR
jgi:hypothetical protein